MINFELQKIIDDFLEAGDFKDVSYNGLQVEGKSEVKRIVTSADASLAAIDAAVNMQADALIVHHGLFWKGANPKVVGPLKERLAALLENGINLYAYHLPLDANLQLGNNRYLLEILDCDEFDYIEPGVKQSVAMLGSLSEPYSVKEICSILCEVLDTRVQIIGAPSDNLLINKVAVCSGAGSFLLDDDPRPPFEALITGEIKEQTYHLAHESGVVVFCVGHHASEQDGVRCLGEYLSLKHGLEHYHLQFDVEKSIDWYESEERA